MRKIKNLITILASSALLAGCITTKPNEPFPPLNPIIWADNLEKQLTEKPYLIENQRNDYLNKLKEQKNAYSEMQKE